jgi:hypothetical protein
MRTIEGFRHTMLTDLNVTPMIADGYTFDGLQFIYGPEDGRVFLTLKDKKYKGVWQTDEWQVIDTLEAGKVEIRRADCGSGCKCAAEIRPLPKKEHILKNVYDEATVEVTGTIDDKGDFVTGGGDYQVIDLEGDNYIYCETCDKRVYPNDEHGLSAEWQVL